MGMKGIGEVMVCMGVWGAYDIISGMGNGI